VKSAVLRMAILFLGAVTVVTMPGPLAVAQSIPSVPEPAPVHLDASTTAILVLDINENPCGAQPRCTGEVVPAVVPLLARARAAGALVVLSTGGAGSPMLPEVGPETSESVMVGAAQDRFFGTALDDMLRAREITTVVIVGWRANGSVLYTSYGAGVRGYTVVVPVDGTSAAAEEQNAVGRFQMLEHLGGNPTNRPLVPGQVTLSRTDLISFE
jgi:nicotinamidase-related amidase